MSRTTPKAKVAKSTIAKNVAKSGAFTKDEVPLRSDPVSFVLTNVSAVKTILSQYVKNKKKIKEFEDDEKLQLTSVSIEDDIPISDILHEKSKRAYYFLDTRKDQNKIWPNMIDVTLAGPLPASTTKLCWWDRHPFQTKPVGCPLRHTSAKLPLLNQVVDTASGGDSRSVKINKKDDPKEIYETEGYFCSFPCCKAYIISRKSETKYKESLSLLTMMFMSFYDKIEYIPPAHTWKILKDYGGHLTIQEYRSSIGRLEYEETVNYKRSIVLSNAQYVLEKKQKILKKK